MPYMVTLYSDGDTDVFVTDIQECDTKIVPFIKRDRSETYYVFATSEKEAIKIAKKEKDKTK